MRRTIAMLLVAAACATLTVTLFFSINSFFLTTPESFDPTALYLALSLVVGSIVVLHVAAAPLDEDADAGWLLTIAIVTGAPAILFAIAMLWIPFLFTLGRGWMVLIFVPVLPVFLGPALGVVISAVYLLRADEPTWQRRVTTVAMIFTATAVAQLLLLVVTRNGPNLLVG